MLFRLAFDATPRNHFHLVITALDRHGNFNPSLSAIASFEDQRDFLDRLRSVNFDPIHHAALANAIRQSATLFRNERRYVEVFLNKYQIEALLRRNARQENPRCSKLDGHFAKPSQPYSATSPSSHRI